MSCVRKPDGKPMKFRVAKATRNPVLSLRNLNILSDRQTKPYIETEIHAMSTPKKKKDNFGQLS